MKKQVVYVFAALIVLVIGLTACKPTAAPISVQTPAIEQTEVLPTISGDSLAMYLPEAVSGTITVAGSSTVFPLSERMMQRFEEEGFTGEITIDSIGSGAGFERFCVNGETDIANASRKIKETEIDSCTNIGRTPIEFRVGTDAIAIVVSKGNTFLSDVTKQELAAIFSNAKKWSDVRTEWPAEDILRFIPGTDSGTFDYFVETVMAPANPGNDGKANVENGEAAILAAENLQMSEDDNVLVQGVEGSPYAIGFFGFAYYSENEEQLNVLAVDGVIPTEASAEDNSYPLSRPLFMYSDAKILQEKPQVAAFIRFYLENVGNEITDVGYFPATQESIQAALDAWAMAVGE